MKLKSILLSLLILFSNLLLAQEVVIKGTITDKKTGSKLAGVTIKVGANGTTSDKEGNFNLTTHISTLTEKGIKFTCIGYLPTRLIYEPNHFYEVGLTQSNDQLKEVVIGAGDDIIKRAIKRIPQNYPDKPMMLTGIIRTQSWRNKSHYFKTDAVVKAYVPPYNGNEKTKVTVLYNQIDSIYDKSLRYIRKIQDYNVVDFQDIVHDKFIFNRISKKRKFDYLLAAKQLYNGHKVFVLNTTLKDTGKVFDKLEATFYIDTASYAIVAANVTFYNWISIGMLKINKGNYIVNYEQVGRKWLLASIHCTVAHEYKNEEPNTTIDFIRTQIDSTNVQPLLYKDIVQMTDDVYLVDKPAKKEEKDVIDSLFAKAEKEGIVEPVPTLLIDTIKKNNAITNSPNQKINRPFGVRLFDYIFKGNIRNLPGITRFALTVNSPDFMVSESVNYGWSFTSSDFRLYKNLFLEFKLNDNFWNNKHIDLSEFALNLTNDFIFNKSARSITLSPFLGYDRLVVNYKKNQVDYNAFNAGLRASFEFTHRKSVFISSGYNFADGNRTLNGLNITPTHYSFTVGVVKKI